MTDTEIHDDVNTNETTAAAPEAKAVLLKIDGDKATVQAVNGGRVVVVSKLGALDYYRLTKVLGESANNPATADLAMLAASVIKVDEHMIPRATKENHLEHTIQMLGFDGLAAVGAGLQALNEQNQGGIDASKN